MQSFRKFVRGPVGITLLVIFTVPFVITGFYGYFQGDALSANMVAEVNGTPIYRNTLNQRVAQMRERVRQQSPGVDDALLSSLINPGMVLQGLVNNELILSASQQGGLHVSDAQAVIALKDAPEFADENGKFSANQMELFLRARGMTPAGFIANVQTDMVMNQYRAGFQDTSFGLPYEVEEQRRLAEQSRTVTFAIKRLAALLAEQAVSDEEIQAYYDSNAADFQEPEQVKLAYLAVQPADFLDSIEVTDEEVRAEYDARRQAMLAVAEQSQSRDLSHILIKTADVDPADVDRRVADIQARLDAGEDFAALAAEVSEDTSTAAQGGQLGTLRRGDLPESLDQAAFALGEAEVSAPVSSDAGVHLLRVNAIQTREVPAFEALADSIRAELKQNHARARVDELATELETLAFEHPDLAQPAESLALSVQQTGFFPLSQPAGFAARPAIVAALQEPEVQDGRNSGLIELADGGYAVVRIAERQPAYTKPLEDVSHRVKATLQREKALAQLADLSEAALVALEDSNVSLESLASEWQVETEEAASVTRRDTAPNAEIIRLAFQVPRKDVDGQRVQVQRLANGDLALLRVDRIADGGAKKLDPMAQSLAAAELGDADGQRNLRQVLSTLRDSAEIDINEDKLADDQPAL